MILISVCTSRKTTACLYDVDAAGGMLTLPVPPSPTRTSLKVGVSAMFGDVWTRNARMCCNERKIRVVLGYRVGCYDWCSVALVRWVAFECWYAVGKKCFLNLMRDTVHGPPLGRQERQAVPPSLENPSTLCDYVIHNLVTANSLPASPAIHFLGTPLCCYVVVRKSDIPV